MSFTQSTLIKDTLDDLFITLSLADIDKVGPDNVAECLVIALSCVV